MPSGRNWREDKGINDEMTWISGENDVEGLFRNIDGGRAADMTNRMKRTKLLSLIYLAIIEIAKFVFLRGSM